MKTITVKGKDYQIKPWGVRRTLEAAPYVEEYIAATAANNSGKASAAQAWLMARIEVYSGAETMKDAEGNATVEVEGDLIDWEDFEPIVAFLIFSAAVEALTGDFFDGLREAAKEKNPAKGKPVSLRSRKG